MQFKKRQKANGKTVLIYSSSNLVSEAKFEAIKEHLAQEVIADTAISDIGFAKNTVNLAVLKQLARVAWYRHKMSFFLEGQIPFLRSFVRLLFSMWLYQRVNGPGSTFEAIAIVGNPFTIEMAHIFKKILTFTAGTKKIRVKLAECGLNKEMIKLLFTGINTISQLDLSDNQLSDEVIEDINFSHPDWAELKSIILANNFLTNRTLARLNRTLEHHINLIDINLTQNPCTDCPQMKILYEHLQDNRVIAKLKLNLKEKTLTLASEMVDDNLIRQIAKMLKAGMEIEKIDFAGKILTVKQMAVLEKVLLEQHCLKNLINVTADISDNLKRLLAYNSRIATIVSSEEKIRNLLRLGMSCAFAAALGLFFHLKAAGFLLHAFYAAPFLGFALASVFVLGTTLPHSYFLQQLNALKNQKSWDASNRYAAQMGRACQTSYRAYFFPSAWKPASYIAFKTQQSEQLLPIDKEQPFSSAAKMLTV